MLLLINLAHSNFPRSSAFREKLVGPYSCEYSHQRHSESDTVLITTQSEANYIGKRKLS
jgi:hypothetical protein